MVDLERAAAFGELAGDIEVTRKETVARVVDLELDVLGRRGVNQTLVGRTSKSYESSRR
jgi:hypothetical protein